MTDLGTREKIATRLCTHFFNDEAKHSPGFRESLDKQVERVLAVAAGRDCVSKRVTYAELNDMQADGAIVEGLTALGVGPDPKPWGRPRPTQEIWRKTA